MKREWTYLAALLPYTTAISSSTAFGASGNDWASDISRHKAKASEDGESAAEGQDDGGGDNSPAGSAAKVPGASSSDDEGGYAPGGGGGGDGGSGVGSSLASVLHISDGMYAPVGGGGAGGHMLLTGSAGGGGGGGGGFSVAAATKTVVNHTTPAIPDTTDGASPGDGLPDDGGIVIPEPADADAMMILLGGMAEGMGDGAGSSGEIVFDIVDYGSITFGYGFATFSASGADGAFADTFFQVEGADLVFSYSEGPSEGFYGLSTTAFSTTHVLAIDFEDDMLFTEQQLAAFDWMQLLAEGPFGQNAPGEERDVSISGNSALMNMFGEASNDSAPLVTTGLTFSFDNTGSAVFTALQAGNTVLSVSGEAESIDSLASASGALLEIEDQYSSVNGVAIGIG